MPFRESPMDFAVGPARYTAPDWQGIGKVAKVWVPDDELVGWAVWQDPDRLAWISASDPESLGYVIRLHVSDLLRDGAAQKVPPLDTWKMILDSTLHTTPEDLYLPAFLADIQRLWN